MVNGVILEALIDTGATFNYISAKALKHTNVSDIDSKFSSTLHKVQVADKSILSTLGSVTLDATLEDHCFTSKFAVLKDLSFDVILGLNFMKENGVIIDTTEEGTIYFKFPNPLLEVKLTQGVSVPAHSYIVAFKISC